MCTYIVYVWESIKIVEKATTANGWTQAENNKIRNIRYA